MHSRYTGRTFSGDVIMVVLVGIFATPFYFLIINSLKTTKDVYVNPIGLPEVWNFRSYADVIRGAGINVNFLSAMMNSIIITGGALLFLVAIGSIAAYSMARNPGIISNLLYVISIVGIIIPSQIGLVPMYTGLRVLGLVGTRLGMIILYVAITMPLTLFVYTGFFRQLPMSFEEAAVIDGAGYWQTFLRVVMPQMKAITGAVLILDSIYIWNDTFDQLVFLGGGRIQTLPVVIYSMSGFYLSKWNIVFAAVNISLLPMVILFLFTQKKMISSLAGGLKG